MTDSDFEKYYQKGGTYVLPIEVFNELFGEIENWKKECKQKENIIKEVREYIENMTKQFESFKDKELITNRVIDISVLEKILEILDKGE